ncbi:MAG: hypothetical protein KJ908_08860 [Acidobacteria bacterium]|nr:hypothetical protein [Acidobacteriota bacterium]MBU4331027.1 hypothetical protein [Acidobacteriota bacterium]
MIILDEIKSIKSEKRELRQFGWVMGTALGTLSLFLFLKARPSAPYFAGTAGLFILLSLVWPRILLPLQKLWMSLAVVLGFFVSRLILMILFYLVLTPVGLLAKLFGKNFLIRKIDPSASSYWVKRPEQHLSPSDYQKQY